MNLNSCCRFRCSHCGESGLQRLPNQPIELTEEQMVEVETIVDKLEDDDDVQAVFTNLE